MFDLGNKKGATNIGMNGILGALLGLFILSVGIVAAFAYFQNNTPVGDAIPVAFETVTGVIMKVFGPLLNLLLGLDGDATINFLKVLTFILISIILVNILDLTSIFATAGEKSDLVNLAVGIIVSIIGIRFMPENMWTFLTSPASAFVATIVAAIPFAALFFITLKLKSGLGRKLMWAFYILVLIYLAWVNSTSGQFWFIFVFFMIAAGFIMFFDRSVRAFIQREKDELELQDAVETLSLDARQKLRTEIKDMTKIIADPDAPDTDKDKAKKKIKKLKTMYGNDLSAI